MEMYFDTSAEKAIAQKDNLTTVGDFFFNQGKTSVEWIMVKSGFEIQLLHLLFCSS